MERYESNGFCEYLKKYEGQHDFKFYDTTKSLLVVAGKQDNEPIMLIIDDRVKKEEYETGLNPYEKSFGNICYCIAKTANLPLFWIRYVDREILNNYDTVSLWEEVSRDKDGRDRDGFRTIQMKDLVSVFQSHNIQAELENRTPQKRKNDSLSSAFHIWQRECLKVGVFADIDLIRFRKNKVESIVELKRSYYGLNSWRPFAKDLNNFSIISNVCRRLGDIPFYILYHEQIPCSSGKNIKKEEQKYYVPIEKKGKPYFDKVDYVKIFHVERRDDVYFYSLPYPVCDGIYRVDDWIFREKE